MSLENLLRQTAIHLCDTSAQLFATQPVYAFLETQAGMNKDVSINTRFLTLFCAYAGGGRIVSYCRDKYRDYFHITEKTKEVKQFGHDTLYLIGFNFVTSPFMYAICGSRDVKELFLGGLIGAGLGLLLGGAEGYSIDAFRDLFGIKPTDRLPEIIRKQPQYTKRAFGSALLASSIFGTAAYYFAI